MKAILVIDMPEECYGCPCSSEGGWNICNITGDDIAEDGRMYNCPLKPMPEKKEVKPEFNNDMDLSYINGWNTCLEEIGK